MVRRALVAAERRTRAAASVRLMLMICRIREVVDSCPAAAARPRWSIWEMTDTDMP
ncbi:hypothetical protein ABIB25_004538 [Nakamurella sp. UYEF19]|uniref:hypothetical protein n=1 Tax=Nakamurella sp. UYEF19 TaxID=1756392 RepID=UPI0033922C81